MATTATPAIVYTTALFSDAHADSLSQSAVDDESGESNEVPSLVLGFEATGTAWVDILGDKEREGLVKGFERKVGP